MAKQSNRMTRINDEVMREASDIIRGEIKDPRLSVLTCVTKAEVTQDLAHAKLFVSVLGSDEQKAQVMEGLKSASGFIRKELAHRINLRNTPELKFVLDESAEYAIKMNALIAKANEQSAE